jgi:hypothetical protein
MQLNGERIVFPKNGIGKCDDVRIGGSFRMLVPTRIT